MDDIDYMKCKEVNIPVDLEKMARQDELIIKATIDFENSMDELHEEYEIKATQIFWDYKLRLYFAGIPPEALLHMFLDLSAIIGEAEKDEG